MTISHLRPLGYGGQASFSLAALGFTEILPNFSLGGKFFVLLNY